MEDSRKLENVVKIFVESLRESKEFNEEQVGNIARGIASALAAIHDPSKKEFREKVNVLKMKLKGSRNASVRAAMLSSLVSPNDFVNLPADKLNPEYFDSLAGSTSSTVATSSTTITQNSTAGTAIQTSARQPPINKGIIAPPPRGLSRPIQSRIAPPAQPSAPIPQIRNPQANQVQDTQENMQIKKEEPVEQEQRQKEVIQPPQVVGNPQSNVQKAQQGEQISSTSTTPRGRTQIVNKREEEAVEKVEEKVNNNNNNKIVHEQNNNQQQNRALPSQDSQISPKSNNQKGQNQLNGNSSEQEQLSTSSRIGEVAKDHQLISKQYPNNQLISNSSNQKTFNNQQESLIAKKGSESKNINAQSINGSSKSPVEANVSQPQQLLVQAQLNNNVILNEKLSQQTDQIEKQRLNRDHDSAAVPTFTKHNGVISNNIQQKQNPKTSPASQLTLGQQILTTNNNNVAIVTKEVNSKKEIVEGSERQKQQILPSNKQQEQNPNKIRIEEQTQEIPLKESENNYNMKSIDPQNQENAAEEQDQGYDSELERQKQKEIEDFNMIIGVYPDQNEQQQQQQNQIVQEDNHQEDQDQHILGYDPSNQVFGDAIQQENDRQSGEVNQGHQRIKSSQSPLQPSQEKNPVFLNSGNQNQLEIEKEQILSQPQKQQIDNESSSSESINPKEGKEEYSNRILDELEEDENGQLSDSQASATKVREEMNRDEAHVEFSVGVLEENRVLKIKLRELISQQAKQEKKSRDEILERDRRIQVLNSQLAETHGELEILQEYIDKIIEENSRCELEYTAIKEIFGKDSDMYREELESLKEKVRVELTHEITTLRAVNQELRSNNETLNQTVEGLIQDLSNSKAIIQKLSAQSLEKLNKNAINPQNSNILNYQNHLESTGEQQELSKSQKLQQQQSQQLLQQSKQYSQSRKRVQPVFESDIDHQAEELVQNQGNNRQPVLNVQLENGNQILSSKVHEHDDNHGQVLLEQNQQEVEAFQVVEKSHQYQEWNNNIRKVEEEQEIELHLEVKMEEQNIKQEVFIPKKAEGRQEKLEVDTDEFFEALLPGRRDTNGKIHNIGVSAAGVAVVSEQSEQQQQFIREKNSEEIVAKKAVTGINGSSQQNNNQVKQSVAAMEHPKTEEQSKKNIPVKNLKQQQEKSQQPQVLKGGNVVELFSQAENTFFSTDNYEFFNTVVSDKFNTSNISAIQAVGGSQHLTGQQNGIGAQKFIDPFEELASGAQKKTFVNEVKKKKRESPAANFFV